MASLDEAPKQKTFEELGLNPALSQKCRDLGMKRPTPVQANCIPRILRGSDCLGCAKTGSGKTAAFVLPIVNDLCLESTPYLALVLTPTRELAHQITDHFTRLGRIADVKCVTIVGGEDVVKQGTELTSKVHVIVATPGRLADHIESGTNMKLSSVKYVIFDEADRLLEGRFNEQLKVICSALSAKRQVLLFSATMSDKLKQFLEMSNKKPFVWISKDVVATVEGLDQKFIRVPAHQKDAYLVYILNEYIKSKPNASIIIFTITCKYCHILFTMLNQLNIPCLALHSAMSQRLRNDALSKFKSFQTRVIVATNLASRGLDFPTVDFVINHNVPREAEVYIHRVGRTARAGKNGSALTLVTPFDVALKKSIEENIGTQLSEYKVNDEEVVRIALEVDHLRKQAEIKLDTTGFGEKKEINKRKREILIYEVS